MSAPSSETLLEAVGGDALEAVFDALLEPALLVDCGRMQVVLANRPAERLYGYPGGRMKGVSLVELAADPARAGDFLRQRRDFVPLRYVRCADGRHQPVQIRARYLERGKEVFAVLALKDASEQVRLEQHSLEPQQKYRAIFDAAPFPILLVASDGVVVEANPSASELYGHGSRSLVGKPLSHFITDAPDIARRLFAERPTLLPANWHCKANGQSFLAEVTIAYLRRREQAMAILVIRDVTDARATLDRLAAAEERWRFALEGADDAVWDWDLSSGRMTISPHLLEKLGWPYDARADNEAVWMDRIHPEDIGRVRLSLANHLSGETETISAEFRLREAQGGYRWKATRGRIMAFDGEGRPLRLIGTLRDIHEQRMQAERDREQQTELAHAGRLMMLGEMASVLAHEINQPLTAMNNFSTLGLKRLAALGDAGEPLRKPLEMIRAQALRAGAIVDRVRGFVRKGQRRFGMVDINALIQGMTEMTAYEARKLGVRVSLDLQRDLPPVRADRLQIEQVTLNLVKNAFDAMSLIDHERVLEIGSRRLGADRVEVSLRDSGPGFPPEDGEQSFEPFKTTKAEGVGLGLSISRSIIEAHGGQLHMERHPLGGAILLFELPILEEKGHEEKEAQS